MQTWLYQMSNAIWPVSQYRIEVREGEPLEWKGTHIPPNKAKNITAGDAIILFYAPSGNDDPGIYGWGVISEYNPKRDILDFHVVSPSDYLKMDPLWDEEIKQVISKIRGKVAQGTLWSISQDDLAIIRSKIRERIHAGVI